MKRLDANRGDDVDFVRRRISEAIAWCGPRVDLSWPKECLRSPAFAPHPFTLPRERMVEAVCSKRWNALERPPPVLASDLAGGRLLIYFPDECLAFGLEEQETRGYFDVENTPPWDTWIAYLYDGERGFLLSWTPPEFVQSAEEGMSFSPDNSLRWLDQDNRPWATVLRVVGLRWSGDQRVT